MNFSFFLNTSIETFSEAEVFISDVINLARSDIQAYFGFFIGGIAVYLVIKAFYVR